MFDDSTGMLAGSLALGLKFACASFLQLLSRHQSPSSLYGLQGTDYLDLPDLYHSSNYTLS